VIDRQLAEGQEPRRKNKDGRLIFADFECSQNLVVGQNKLGPIYQHRVLLAIAQCVSDQCRGENWRPDEECNTCRNRHEVIFVGEDALDRFIGWLMRPSNANVSVLFHNFRGSAAVVYFRIRFFLFIPAEIINWFYL